MLRIVKGTLTPAGLYDSISSGSKEKKSARNKPFTGCFQMKNKSHKFLGSMG